VDATGSIKVIDFGIAGEATGRRLTFDKISQLTGTPDYIPEPVKGNRGDSRSGIHALGVILYEMPTARRPFREPTRSRS
jgi:serine/threonine-protein kinase